MGRLRDSERMAQARVKAERVAANPPQQARVKAERVAANPPQQAARLAEQSASAAAALGATPVAARIRAALESQPESVVGARGNVAGPRVVGNSIADESKQGSARRRRKTTGRRRKTQKRRKTARRKRGGKKK